MKIGLISDIHASVAPLLEAFTIFEQENVDEILLLGDMAGYGEELEQSVQLLSKRECIAILGNHDVWYVDRHTGSKENGIKKFFHNLPVTWGGDIMGKRVFAVHASPPSSMVRGITLLDRCENIMFSMRDQWALELDEYNFDVLAVGHTHQVYAETLGRTLVINPGSTKFNNCCAVLSLPEMEAAFFSLAGRPVRKVWHWGDMIR